MNEIELDTDCVKCGANHPNDMDRCQMCGTALLPVRRFKRKKKKGFYIRKEYLYIDDGYNDKKWRVFITICKSWWYRSLKHCYIIPIQMDQESLDFHREYVQLERERNKLKKIYVK